MSEQEICIGSCISQEVNYSVKPNSPPRRIQQIKILVTRTSWRPFHRKFSNVRRVAEKQLFKWCLQWYLLCLQYICLHYIYCPYMIHLLCPRACAPSLHHSKEYILYWGQHGGQTATWKSLEKELAMWESSKSAVDGGSYTTTPHKRHASHQDHSLECVCLSCVSKTSRTGNCNHNNCMKLRPLIVTAKLHVFWTSYTGYQ